MSTRNGGSIALPVIEPLQESPGEIEALQAEIRELARRRNAVVLAHNYQRAEVQDVADFVGDSLGLSRQAARTEAEVIIFAGVHFMAETAAILSPQKRVLLPDLRAGCSLAATITAEDVRRWKAEFPDYISVGYVNTTAEVKAELDYCCTSGNVLDVIDAIPADRASSSSPTSSSERTYAACGPTDGSRCGWASATSTRGFAPRR